MKKIKYVQLEPAAVLLDFLSSRMTAEQFGCYWLIMMNLYCQAGKLEFDLNELGMLCNHSESFEKIWEKIESKFQIKNGFIKHKRVTAELRRAKKFLQHQRKAGLASARSRQQRLNHGSAELQPSKRNESEEKERKIKENEAKVSEEKQSYVNHSQEELRQTRITPSVNNISSCLSSITARVSPSGQTCSKQLKFNSELRRLIAPRSQSDKTAFRNIGNWLRMQVELGKHGEDIFDAVLDIAEEIANDEGVRNPAAVLTERLKRELNYQP